MLSRPAYRRSFVLLSLIALMMLGLPTPRALGDVATATTGEAAPAEKPAAPEVPAEMRTPQAALEAFIKRMQANEKSSAAELLDLSQLSAVAIDSRGPDLAYKLYRLITAIGDPPTLGEGESLPWYSDKAAEAAKLDFSNAESKPDYDQSWSIKDWLNNPAPEAEQITIARDGANRWRFSAETVAVIDSLYEKFEEKIDQLRAEREKETANGETVAEAEPTEPWSMWVRNLVPKELRPTYFLLPIYQWLILLTLIPLGFLVDWAIRAAFTRIGDIALCRLDPDFAEERKTTESVWRPVGRLAHATIWVVGARLIDLPPGLTSVLLTVLVIVTIVAAVLALFAVLDLGKDYLQRKAKRDHQRFNDLFLPLANTTAKIAVGILGVIATIAVFNKQLPAALLGGLGIGGIAIALASQETLSNFLGSITLLVDRPFEVGDNVKIDAVEGSVESLGFRSTRIRTGLDSQVTLPNSKLASSSIDNLGRRKYRRYLGKLNLEYGTPPDRIDAFCEGVRELVRRHPHTRKDFYAVYLNDITLSSLDILVVVFFEVPDYPTELRERHRLLTDILRLADRIGVTFAYVSQQVQLDANVFMKDAPDLPDTDPTKAGARIAAEIAGELPNYQDRPGPVKFPSATSFD